MTKWKLTLRGPSTRLVEADAVIDRGPWLDFEQHTQNGQTTKVDLLYRVKADMVNMVERTDGGS